MFFHSRAENVGFATMMLAAVFAAAAYVETRPHPLTVGELQRWEEPIRNPAVNPQQLSNEGMFNRSWAGISARYADDYLELCRRQNLPAMFNGKVSPGMTSVNIAQCVYENGKANGIGLFSSDGKNRPVNIDQNSVTVMLLSLSMMQNLLR